MPLYQLIAVLRESKLRPEKPKWMCCLTLEASSGQSLNRKASDSICFDFLRHRHRTGNRNRNAFIIDTHPTAEDIDCGECRSRKRGISAMWDNSFLGNRHWHWMDVCATDILSSWFGFNCDRKFPISFNAVLVLATWRRSFSSLAVIYMSQFIR